MCTLATNHVANTENTDMQLVLDHDERPGYAFVYGTLMSGEHNHHVMGVDDDMTEYLCDARAIGKMYHLGGFPGVRFDELGDMVYGELYRVLNPHVHTHLDRLEGVHGTDGLYLPYMVPVYTCNKELDNPVMALAYHINHKPSENSVMANGRWVESIAA